MLEGSLSGAVEAEVASAPVNNKVQSPRLAENLDSAQVKKLAAILSGQNGGSKVGDSADALKNSKPILERDFVGPVQNLLKNIGVAETDLSEELREKIAKIPQENNEATGKYLGEVISAINKEVETKLAGSKELEALVKLQKQIDANPTLFLNNLQMVTANSNLDPQDKTKMDEALKFLEKMSVQPEAVKKANTATIVEKSKKVMSLSKKIGIGLGAIIGFALFKAFRSSFGKEGAQMGVA